MRVGAGTEEGTVSSGSLSSRVFRSVNSLGESPLPRCYSYAVELYLSLLPPHLALVSASFVVPPVLDLLVSGVDPLG